LRPRDPNWIRAAIPNRVWSKDYVQVRALPGMPNKFDTGRKGEGTKMTYAAIILLIHLFITYRIATGELPKATGGGAVQPQTWEASTGQQDSGWG